MKTITMLMIVALMPSLCFARRGFSGSGERPRGHVMIIPSSTGVSAMGVGTAASAQGGPSIGGGNFAASADSSSLGTVHASRNNISNSRTNGHSSNPVQIQEAQSSDSDADDASPSGFSSSGGSMDPDSAM